MNRLFFVVFFICVWLVVAKDEANAQPGRRLFWRYPIYHQRPMPHAEQYDFHPHNRYNYDYDELYPKYYGGFHSRHLYNYGLSPGDVGLRGNGIFWTPW
jgi:hypothetical protein